MKQPYPIRADRGGLQAKMQEYLTSGLSLDWLIDPQNNQVEIYRPNQDVEIIKLPGKLLG